MALCSQAQDTTGLDKWPSRTCGGVHVLCRYIRPGWGAAAPTPQMPQIRLHSEVGRVLKLSHVLLRVGWALNDSSTALGKQHVPCMEHTRWQHHTIYHHAISLGQHFHKSSSTEMSLRTHRCSMRSSGLVLPEHSLPQSFPLRCICVFQTVFLNVGNETHGWVLLCFRSNQHAQGAKY